MKSLRINVMVCLALLAGATAFSREALTSIAAVRVLPPESAAENLPVEVEVTVTYVDMQEHGLFVHDGQEGIYLKEPTNLIAGPVVEAGTRLRLHARTHEGEFMPKLICESLEVLGRSPMPKPLLVNEDNLFAPGLDCQWVKVSGVIIGTEPIVDGYFVFDMELFGWTIKLLLPESSQLIENAPKLMQRRVCFDGVAATVYNAQRQMTGRYFFIPSSRFISPIDEAPKTIPTVVPGVDDLLRSSATAESWVSLRGIITHATKNELYVRGKGGSLKVFVAEGGNFKPGDQVEANGFATIAPFRPQLRARAVQLLRHGPPPKPIPLSEKATELASLPAELIEVKAEYLGRRDNPDAIVMECRTGERLFEALLTKYMSLPEKLASGATLRLVGTCELTTSLPLPRTQWVDGFRLHLRGPEDLEILTLPSWWTTGRLLTVLAIVAGLGLMLLAWGWTLRRRVLAQTEIIGAHIEREAVLNERRRLAREFHDTLEQDLTGVAFQLDNAEQRLESAPGKVRESLEMAKIMLRQSREEARTSINDLRSVLLEQVGLGAALREMLPPLVAEKGPALVCQETGNAWRMEAAVENQLLRIAREAVSNAARHSGATRIEVELAWNPEFARLLVADNGRGFDITTRPSRGHFGLLGLQERAQKIGALLKIKSGSLTGTTVIVTLPLERMRCQRSEQSCVL